ncbi:hypothetical protein C463_02276 [Halorubrum californiense DSM 19288]|uniref:Uncharacterized protein n=1 Tax=Halorubrum californiense DSM 19288 TaxID=1227465 RepID=M0EKG7_9EURY|nr:MULTISPECIES: hypothetical protein [Halorubrum]ELZ47553.1 hypothetical protein C463_02276 [Halorubrum californiense DSM 19288]TKX71721.1 hypothetical protein EXE40_07255 [Halorubrum sp. GN11GM_10-3_MGM]
MNHDRVHAREPSHHVDRWTVGVVESIGERDGHCVVTVRPIAPEGEEGDETAADAGRGELVELTLTLAVRDLFVSRLAIDDDESPVGERVWYRKRGG